MQMRLGADPPIKADRGQHRPPQTCHSSTVNMVKYFSVDWLAQNHHNTIQGHCADMDTTLPCKPHIPCMVQPSPPPIGKSFLQIKSKAVKRFEHLGPAESCEAEDSTLCSPLDPSNCTPPSKYPASPGFEQHNRALRRRGVCNGFPSFSS